MALIPPDAGIRMRMQTEANLLQPVTPVHEISADLPDLLPGRVFTARIQEALPENTYRALVAGKTITLSLPEGARTGDQMELVVVDRSAGSITARQVQAEAGGIKQTGNAQPDPFTRLSPAAQLIGQLLPGEGKSPPPAPLNRGQPLLSAPPTSPTAAAQLAPTLAKAVTQSGLFYEAHQAQWVSGKLPLAQLLQEPQGQYSTPAAFQLATHEAMPTAPQQPQQPDLPLTARQTDAMTSPPPAAAATDAQNTQSESPATGQTAPAPAPAPASASAPAPAPAPATDHPATAESTGPNAGNPPQTLVGNHEKVGVGGTASHTGQLAQTGQPAQQMPEELRPLVQQQLEAVATQRVFWHGEAWPQQSIDWEIEWERQGEGQSNAEEDSVWRTALSLTTPRLGHVDAALQLTAGGVRILLTTADDTSATDLRGAGQQLAEALSAANVPLLAFQVKQIHEHPATGAS